MTSTTDRSTRVPTLGSRTFANPPVVDGGTLTRPDPFISRHLGRYYCFATGLTGITLTVSDDLVTWEPLPAPLLHEGKHNFWAPCVAQIDGAFYLYYSCRAEDSDDPHDELLFAARSERIEGPYSEIVQLSETFAIDPHVVRDTDGEWYMFYSTNEPTGLDDEFAGTSILVDRLPSPTTLAGRPQPVVQPSIDEEVFERNRFGGGRDWYTIEGASYFTHGNRAFLTYSGNAYEREDYFIGYASATLDRPLGDLKWTKHPSAFDHAPLVRRTAQVEGTGHNSITTAPNLVDRWIVYHGRDARTPIKSGAEQRIMRIDPFFFSGDRLVTPAPTLTEQGVPALPTISSRFSGDGAAGWRVIEGTPTLTETALETRDEERVLAVHEHTTTSYVAEVSVRGMRGHAGARYGILPWVRAADDYLEVVYDAVSQAVRCIRHTAGFVTTEATWPISSPVENRWTLFRVVRSLDLVEVWLDDERVGSIGVAAVPASVGLVSTRTRTEFAAFALTDHVALHGKRLAALASSMTVAPSTRVDEDGITSPSRRAVTITGSQIADECAITTELELVSPHGRFELQPVYADHENNVSIRVDPHSYQIVVVVAGTERVVAEGESAQLRHASIRTQRSGNRLLVFLDDVLHEVPLVAASGAWRTVLVGARLRSYEMTSYAPWRTNTDAVPHSTTSGVLPLRELL
jgi:GH43 family beta-xylosidase